MARHLRHAFLTLAALLSIQVCSGAHVSAQSAADKAAAEALFDRGLSLLKEGKYQEACARLEESQAIERGIGTMLYLAECYEKVGRSASAWALFREAASSAQAAGQAERAEAGRRRAEKIEKTLSRLAIQVPAASRVAGLVLQDNGSTLQPAVWGVALPVDPGVHRIEASAPGYKPWANEVKVEDRAASAEITVPALEKDPNAVAAVAPTPSETAQQGGLSSAPSPTSQAAPVAQGMSTMRIVGIALGAAGIVGIGVGAITGGLAMGKKNDYKDKRREDGRTDEVAKISKDAHNLGNVSTGTWIAGGALLAGGLITYFLAPKHDDKRPEVALYADPKSAGVRVGGVF